MKSFALFVCQLQQDFDMCDLDTLPIRRISVPKSASLPELVHLVADHMRYAPHCIRLWRVLPR